MGKFAIYEALGNRYLVAEMEIPPAGEFIHRRCVRHHAHGMVLGRLAGDGRHWLRIFNRDGSEAEMSGNGVRILAKFFHDRGKFSDFHCPLHLANGGVVPCEINPADGTVTAHSIGYAVDPRPLTLAVAGQIWKGYRVQVSNPHFVLPADPIPADWRAIAAQMEREDAFPGRTNVEFLGELGKGKIDLRIHERGVGETPSCGSGSIAAAAIAHGILGHPSHLEVHMHGGVLAVELARDGAAIRGPVRRILRH
jgi:diaminopimelate epimerase